MRTLRLPYGVAVGPSPATNVGSLIDSNGAFFTPTFGAGDVKITADDPTAVDDNIDTLPTLRATHQIHLALSAAEMAPPVACGGVRMVSVTDTGALSFQVRVETEDHPLAFDTKGCVASVA